jgi:hypothetical protein
MPLLIDLEQMENQWIAHAGGLFGCFHSAGDPAAAREGLPAAVRAYLGSCARLGILQPDVNPSGPVVVRERIAEWVHPLTQEAVNAFFAGDVPPLSDEEIARAARLLDWTYAGLLEAVEGLPGLAYNRKVEGEWTISGIIHHAGRADGWYLERLGLAPPGFRDIDDERALLARIHNHLQEVLPGLAGLARVDTVDGELWSPRKLLRRSLWHRRDHAAHIRQFRDRLGL